MSTVSAQLLPNNKAILTMADLILEKGAWGHIVNECHFLLLQKQSALRGLSMVLVLEGQSSQAQLTISAEAQFS